MVVVAAVVDEWIHFVDVNRIDGGSAAAGLVCVCAYVRDHSLTHVGQLVPVRVTSSRKLSASADGKERHVRGFVMRSAALTCLSYADRRARCCTRPLSLETTM